jgi:hypothetical protein
MFEVRIGQAAEFTQPRVELRLDRADRDIFAVRAFVCAEEGRSAVACIGSGLRVPCADAAPAIQQGGEQGRSIAN